MSVILYPSEILRHKTARVEKFDAALRETVRAMFEAMYAANGVGLAGPQANIPLQLSVMNCTGKPEGELVMINPEIIELDGAMTGEEGCLSFPGIYIELKRAARVKVRFQDIEGREQVLEAQGLLARAVQHEVDHLNGVLLIDKMTVVQRLAHRGALKMLELRHLKGQEAVAATPGRPASEP